MLFQLVNKNNYITKNFKFIYTQTTLLHLLLKELPITMGKMLINGTISYASQEPWLFSGTVKNNILFGQVYDENKYNQVRIIVVI